MNTKIIIATLGAASAMELMQESDYKFMGFVAEHGRSYATKAEFDFRSKVFAETLKRIEEHNSEEGHQSTVGLNFMADWTDAERKRLNGYKGEALRENIVILDESNLATEVNWVTKGAVTPVKNQGQCGSCWAFSSTGAIEGADFVNAGNGVLNSLSEQHLVDCVTSCYGCNGGLMDYAFKYAERNPVDLERDYGYTARDGSCKAKQYKGVGKVSGFKDVSNSASQLKAALNKQPVAVAIEADQYAFQGYTGGVITKGCGSNLDHGVLAVGYGVEKDTEYVLVKNSWGPSWGVKGYVKMAFNQCGVTTSASYPNA